MIGFYAAGAMGQGGGGGGGGGGTPGYFDPANIGAAISLGTSNGNADSVAACSTAGWRSARGLVPVSAGKWYAECDVIKLAAAANAAFGVGQSTVSLVDMAGNSSVGWSLQSYDGSTGARLRNSNAYSGTAITAVAENEYFRVALDCDNGRCWLGNPSQWYGGGNPAAGTSPTFTFTPGTPMYLFGSIFGASTFLRLRTRGAEFAGAVPSGFTAWGGAGGTAEKTKYRYWRIFVTANNGDANFTSIAEMIFRIGGFDVTTGGTPSASTDYFGGNGARGFDKSTLATNTWVTASGARLNCWLKYDFGVGKGKAMDTVWLYAEPGFLTRAPNAFVIEASPDDSTWTTLHSASGVTGWVANTEKTFGLP